MPGERPVEAADLDLTLAALFAGYALADEVQRRVAAAGFGGLRFAHGVVIQHLVEGPQTVTRLGELMGVTQQAASKAAGELERLGYVERRPAGGDARVRLVSLTERGRAAVAAAREARGAVVAELRERHGAARVDAAAELLRDVLRERGAMPDIRRRRVRPPA